MFDDVVDMKHAYLEIPELTYSFSSQRSQVMAINLFADWKKKYVLTELLGVRTRRKDRNRWRSVVSAMDHNGEKYVIL